MTNARHNLEALKAHFADVTVYLPEIKNEIVSLHTALENVLALNLRAPTRLMGLDLQNVVENIAKTLVFKQRDISNVHLQNAITDIRVLVLDMHERAQTLIEQESQIISLSANASNNRVTAAPMDLTTQMEKFAVKAPSVVTDAPAYAIPTPAFNDGPGTILDIQDLYNNADDSAFGRVSGSFYTVDSIIKAKAISQGSSILPAGCMVVIKPHQVFKLFVSASNYSDRFTAPAPRSTEIRERLMEAGPDGVVLYGPAAFKILPDMEGALSQNKAHFQKWTNCPPEKGPRAIEENRTLVARLKKSRALFGTGMVLGTLSFATVMFTRQDTWLTIILTILLLMSFGYSLYQFAQTTKKISELQRAIALNKEQIAAQVEGYVYIVQNPAFDKLCKIRDEDLEDMDDRQKIKISRDVFASIAQNTSKHKAMNFRPAFSIESSGLGDVQLLAPLLALPSPAMVAQPIEPTKAPLAERVGDFGGKRTII